MKRIYKKDGKIIFEYFSDGGLGWLIEKLDNGYHCLNGFEFKKQDILEYIEDENTIKFLLSEEKDNYYSIVIDGSHSNGRINYLLHDDDELNLSKILIGRHSNVFKEISKIIINKRVVKIGGPNCDISIKDFNNLTNAFPKQREKELYYYKRVQLILENYFDNLMDSKYEKHVNKKFVNKTYEKDINKIILYGIGHYELVLESLKENLKKSDAFSEADWKKYIAEIILLLFPKYINYHKEAYIKLNKSRKKKEFLDFILVKDNGAVDVLEVKKPDCNSIISNTADHGNYYSTNTLSKVVMQTEKYVYNLNRNVEFAEKRFNTTLLSGYPKDFKFKIMNPKGLIIIGQADKYLQDQLEDLEIIRRMYSNIIEIITYDDMINMLERQIELLKKKAH